MRKWILIAMLFTALSMSLMGVTYKVNVIGGGPSTNVKLHMVYTLPSWTGGFDGDMEYVGPNSTNNGSIFSYNDPGANYWYAFYATVTAKRDWGGEMLTGTSYTTGHVAGNTEIWLNTVTIPIPVKPIPIVPNPK